MSDDDPGEHGGSRQRPGVLHEGLRRQRGRHPPGRSPARREHGDPGRAPPRPRGVRHGEARPRGARELQPERRRAGRLPAGGPGGRGLRAAGPEERRGHRPPQCLAPARRDRVLRLGDRRPGG